MHLWQSAAYLPNLPNALSAFTQCFSASTCVRVEKKALKAILPFACKVPQIPIPNLLVKLHFHLKTAVFLHCDFHYCIINAMPLLWPGLLPGGLVDSISWFTVLQFLSCVIQLSMSMWPQYTSVLATFIIIDSLVLTIIVVSHLRVVT